MSYTESYEEKEQRVTSEERNAYVKAIGIKIKYLALEADHDKNTIKLYRFLDRTLQTLAYNGFYMEYEEKNMDYLGHIITITAPDRILSDDYTVVVDRKHSAYVRNLISSLVGESAELPDGEDGYMDHESEYYTNVLKELAR